MIQTRSIPGDNNRVDKEKNSLMWRIFLAVLIGSLWVEAQEDTCVKLEYQSQQKSVPGQPGFIDYFTIWVSPQFLRRDINNEVSTVIDLEKKVRLEINHLTQTFHSSESASSPDEVHFVRSVPATALLKNEFCDVYETKGEFESGTYEIKIWITQKEVVSGGHNLLELLTNQSLERAFNGPVPAGIPVRFSVSVFGQDATEPVTSIVIELQKREELKVPDNMFQVPLEYQEEP